MSDETQPDNTRGSRFWAETKEDLKWAVPLMVTLVLIGPVFMDDAYALFGLNPVDSHGYASWEAPPEGTEELPRMTDDIFGRFVVPFEILSVLLLAALVAGVVIAARDPERDA